VPALAELVAAPGKWARRYTLADLQAAAEDWGPPPEDFIDTLPISARMKNLIRGIDDPARAYKSRSERVRAVMVAMVGAGCTEETIRAVFLDPQYPISAHVLEKGNFDRQLFKARLAVLDPDVRELNKTYAVVLVGSRAAVMKEGLSILGNQEFNLYGVDAFNTWFGNRTVMEGKKQVTLAKHWLAHPRRRQYEGIVFAPKREVPGFYNLWQGFAVEPKAGDCGLFLDHIRDVACCGSMHTIAGSSPGLPRSCNSQTTRGGRASSSAATPAQARRSSGRSSGICWVRTTTAWPSCATSPASSILI
jgi:hypothetical protein